MWRPAGSDAPPRGLGSHGTVEDLHARGGQLIGAIPHARIVTRSARLEAGDTLLLYTDGLTEARTGPTVAATATKPSSISLGASHLSWLPVASQPSENRCTPSDPEWRTIPPFSRSTRYPRRRARRADPEPGHRAAARSVAPRGAQVDPRGRATEPSPAGTPLRRNGNGHICLMSRRIVAQFIANQYSRNPGVTMFRSGR
ncbi:SpoIIE family protein phosphatase [Nocardia gipuzkoensis]